jgi:oxygen-dependent protoporphyrinogen oxidase
MSLEAEPVLARVFRFPQASAQMRVGHLARMRAVHERLARAAPRLRVAGGGYDGVGIPDCIRQGQEAGRALVEG